MRPGAEGRTTLTVSKRSWSIVAAGLLGIGASSSALAEEGTVQTLAPWQGSGQVFVVAPEKVMILANYTWPWRNDARGAGWARTSCTSCSSPERGRTSPETAPNKSEGPQW